MHVYDLYCKTQNYNDGVICMGVWRETSTHHVPASVCIFLQFPYSSRYHSKRAASPPAHALPRLPFSCFCKALMYRKRGKAKWSISLPMSEKLKWVSLGFLLHRCGERESIIIVKEEDTQLGK